MTAETGWMKSERDGARLVVALGGRWSIAEAARLDRELRGLAPGPAREVSIDIAGVEALDTAGTVIVLRANTLEGVVEELTAALDLDWLYRPFSRCLVCNTPLVEADAPARARLPEGAGAPPGPVHACLGCDKLYWAGGHVRRMRARLETWARTAPAP